MVRRLLLTIAAVLLCPLPVRADITSNLELHWKFDDETANDSSGNGRHGTLNNSPTFGTGQINGCLVLAANTNSVTRADAAAIDSGRSDTLAFWIKFTSYANGAVLTKMEGADSNMRGLRTETNAFYGTTGVSNIFDIDTWVTTGAWHHVALVWDSSGTCDVFVDGTERVSNASLADWFDNSGNLHVGSSQFSVWTGTTSLACSIDDVRVYSRALSASDVTELHEWTEATSTFRPRAIVVGQLERRAPKWNSCGDYALAL